ncbi:YtxH domain-containing protein [Chryseobacterium sp. A321]
MGNKRNGLLALLGLGAFAWWKYKNSTPEDQQKVKDQLDNVKNNVNKWGSDIKNKANDVASQVQSKAGEYTKKAEDTAQDIKSDLN